MQPDRLRWTDSRLDDRFETVTGELRALRDVPAKLGELRGDLRRVKSDTDAVHSALRELRDDFAEYVEQQRVDFGAYVEHQQKAQEAHRVERKADRRWMVGAVFTAAGLIVAAMSILLSHL